jgi:hypothetical protein
MTQWYYRRRGHSHGPFSPKQFKQLALTGRIQPSDELRRNDMPDWVAGTKIEGLFPRMPVRSPDSADTPSGRRSRKGRFLGLKARAILIAAAICAAALALGMAFVWRH